jgi:hypothetical protein
VDPIRNIPRITQKDNIKIKERGREVVNLVN